MFDSISRLKEERISTLGIPKSLRCPGCGKRYSLRIEERKSLAGCIIANGAGIWALSHCPHCGYVDKIYPTRINGVSITPAECKKLYQEMEQFIKEKRGEDNENE